MSNLMPHHFYAIAHGAADLLGLEVELRPNYHRDGSPAFRLKPVGQPVGIFLRLWEGRVICRVSVPHEITRDNHFPEDERVSLTAEITVGQNRLAKLGPDKATELLVKELRRRLYPSFNRAQAICESVLRRDQEYRDARCRLLSRVMRRPLHDVTLREISQSEVRMSFPLVGGKKAEVDIRTFTMAHQAKAEINAPAYVIAAIVALLQSDAVQDIGRAGVVDDFLRESKYTKEADIFRELMDTSNTNEGED
jgi:hypothetical protein